MFTQINISVIFMKLEGGGGERVCDIGADLHNV